MLSGLSITAGESFQTQQVSVHSTVLLCGFLYNREKGFSRLAFKPMLSPSSSISPGKINQGHPRRKAMVAHFRWPRSQLPGLSGGVTRSTRTFQEANGEDPHYVGPG